ncbi:two-component sensor histidine kinase [Deinococcus irradiatisoli]|uniref:histidine kinase n=1 Tax=Deinococcus irradiatisoli TaxID=2202254 RepID=A0A2Z3JGP6_9DEIO|nr:ATP-binding protein [Deinococcus irradiatisoli]AWN24165.1 two-component sensor histidine kinase [Deinococcus irradiatisoli]
MKSPLHAPDRRAAEHLGVRTWPWQRLSVSIIAAMLLMTVIMAISMVAVSSYSVQRQFDNMPPELRSQFEQGVQVDVGRKLAQGITTPRFSLVPSEPANPAPSPDGLAQTQPQTQQPTNHPPNTQQPPRLSRAERIRRDLLTNLLWAITISGVTAVFIGALLARLISRPVDEVSRAAQQVAGGNLAARARQWPGNLELINLTRNFNRMAGSLDTLERERRDMIADIAHELRTPLAVVQARLDAFEDQVLEPTPQELALVSMQIGLLTRLVSDLRTLSLADAGRLPLQLAPLDLSALSLRISQSFASKAQAADIRLDLQLPDEELPVQGDRDRLGQVLVNLLENALRYTPAGGQVTVSAGRRQGQAVLSVCDSGPGFPAGSEQQVFTRFFRADQSRTRDSGGTGLGLAIVAALVGAHGGAVQARNAQGGGAEVEVCLPLHEESETPENENGWRELAARAS